ncbi:alpha/beta fold hydrolase [Synechococcus sp. CCY 0621]|uniref:alpha/beta hydrolase n=1 Tax=Synechococcus sp. CCY 0621 TaxID=2815603 RepID=UPI0025703E30|nr:alpha/beta fold hydrolase [Synechococcus sp. CCY 0621]
MIPDDGGSMTNPSTPAGVHLITSTGTLHGTQIIPTSHLPTPVVLIIAGSGPTDRNGNGPLAGENNSLKQLAEGLADHGIASIRYDKRGIGESSSAGPEEVDLRFDTYAEDAALWIQQLQVDPRFSGVTVIGHSEGSLIGMLATYKAEADAFVSIAGPAQSASAILRKQLQSRLPESLWQQSEQILVSLEQGNPVISAPPELHMLFRASVQPYLMSWFRYTPAQEIMHLTIPALIVQGTTDIQVPVSEAKALKTAKPDAELRMIEGMNHVLKAVSLDPKQQNASYSDPTLPVVPELVEGISQFIHARERLRASHQLLHRNEPH